MVVVMASEWISKKKHSDKERWICLYPAYLNNKKTRAEGRLIPLDKGVENPHVTELRDVLASTGLKIGVENKSYPRETSHEPHCKGRIRVQIKDDDGEIINPKFPTRESLLLYCGEMIPKLKSRLAGSKGATGDSEVQQAQPSASSSGGGGGKKNRKKK